MIKRKHIAATIAAIALLTVSAAVAQTDLRERLMALRAYPEAEVAALATEELGNLDAGKKVTEDRVKALELYALACDYRAFCGNDALTDDAKAESIYVRISETDTTFYPAMNAVGVMCYFRGDNECAVEYSTRALGINDRCVAAYTGRGAALFQLGRFEESLADFEKVSELNPGDVWVMTFMGRALGALGRYDEATAVFDEAAGIDPYNAELIGARISLYKDQMKEPVKALEMLDGMLESEPGRVDTLVTRGRLKMELGYYEAASMDFSRAAAADSENPELWSMKGQAELKRRRFAVAVVSLDVAVDLNPGESVYYWYRAQAKHGMGDYSDALKDWNRSLELEPGNAKALAGRAATLIALGDVAAAGQDVAKATSIEENSARVVFARGLLAAAQGDAALARSAFDVLVSNFPSELDFVLARAELGYKNGDYVQASKDYERAIDLGADDEQVREKLIDSEFKGRQYHSLIERIGPDQEAIPEDPKKKIMYGVALKGTRGATSAIEFLTRLIDGGDEIADAYYYRARYVRERMPDPWFESQSMEEVGKAFRECAKDLLKARTISPDDGKIAYELGFVLMEQGHYLLRVEGDLEAARKAYRMALDAFIDADRLGEPGPSRHFYEGVLYMRLGKLDEAAEAVNRGLSEIESAPMYEKLALIHYLRGDYPRAISAVSRAIEIQDTDVRRNLRGNIYYKAGRYQEAARDYREAEKLAADGYVTVPREERYFYSIDTDPVVILESISGPGEPAVRRLVQIEIRTVLQNRGHALLALGDRTAACEAFNRARVLGLADGFNLHCR